MQSIATVAGGARQLAPIAAGSLEWDRAWLQLAELDARDGAADRPQDGWRYERTVARRGIGVVHQFSCLHRSGRSAEVPATDAYEREQSAARKAAKRRAPRLTDEDGIDGPFERAIGGRRSRRRRDTDPGSVALAKRTIAAMVAAGELPARGGQ